jgi:LuxR family maltose regulon positive regulatory protein
LRERLFDLLDDARRYSVVWIAGPPGGGKTTLASTYVATAKMPCVWYQMDGADADPATFFSYLRSVAPKDLVRGKKLPLFTAEYLHDIAGFARRFFRDFYSRAPHGTVIVLDNYHEVSLQSKLHAGLASAFEEIPHNSSVLVLSRVEPPAAYARLQVGEALTILDWSALRLTREEINLIAGSRGSKSHEVTDFLFERTDGWAAGVMLLLENFRRNGMQFNSRTATSAAAFDYFASQIFDPISAEARELLIMMAVANQLTAPLLEQLTGNQNAEQVLEHFYQRQLFVYRKQSNPPWYHLHALFREFLLDVAKKTLPASKLNEMRQKAAAGMATAGFAEQAIPLLLEARDWKQAERLIIQTAPALIEQGRWQTLQDWICGLPSQPSTNPWLPYWRARSQITVDPPNAAKWLEETYNSFKAIGDSIGQLLAATGVLEAMYFSFSDFVSMDPWVDRIVQLLEQGIIVRDNEDDLRVHAAIMMAATYRSPDHDIVKHCVQRVQELLAKPCGVNLKVMVCTMLHAYGNVAADAGAELLARRIARPLMNAPALTTWTKAFYIATEGYVDYVRGRYEEAFSCFDEASAIATENTLISLLVLCEIWRGLAQRRAGLIKAAEDTATRVKVLGLDQNSYHASLFLLLEASVSFANGKLDIASAKGIAAYRSCVDRGHFFGSMLTGMVASNFSVAGGQTKQAEELLMELRTQAVGRLRGNYAGAIGLNQAWLAHRQGQSADRDKLLRECLVLSREHSQRLRYQWYQNALADLLPVAISRKIESEAAFELAREFNVIPSSLAGDEWPWPVKIYCLGSFELNIAGGPPRFSRKLPRKVLLLLKVLIGFGESRVSEAKILDALWPNEDGDAAHRALTATVHRLRRLLIDPASIKQQAGTLSLDPKKCWTDVRYFEDLVGADHSNYLAAVKIYRGAFLAQEEHDPWVVSRREKLRAKFIHAVCSLGKDPESTEDFEQAARFYERGLEADASVEPFYQGLMRCYARIGRRDDAMRIYERCRDVLFSDLGQPPSPSTERLYQSLIVRT